MTTASTIITRRSPTGSPPSIQLKWRADCAPFFTLACDLSGLTNSQPAEKLPTREVSRTYRLPYQRPRP